jgi:hypothetical protein
VLIMAIKADASGFTFPEWMLGEADEDSLTSDDWGDSEVSSGTTGGSTPAAAADKIGRTELGCSSDCPMKNSEDHHYHFQLGCMWGRVGVLFLDFQPSGALTQLLYASVGLAVFAGVLILTYDLVLMARRLLVLAEWYAGITGTAMLFRTIAMAAYEAVLPSGLPALKRLLCDRGYTAAWLQCAAASSCGSEPLKCASALLQASMRWIVKNV